MTRTHRGTCSKAPAIESRTPLPRFGDETTDDGEFTRSLGRVKGIQNLPTAVALPLPLNREVAAHRAVRTILLLIAGRMPALLERATTEQPELVTHQ